MPSSQLRHIIRDAAVWFAWFVLTGRFRHGGTYGDLKRLSAREAAYHLAMLGVTVAVVAHIWVNMPHVIYGYFYGFLGISAGLGGFLVVTSIAVNRFLDWRMFRRGRANRSK